MVEDAGEADDDPSGQLPPLKALALALGDPKAWVMALSLTAMVVALSFNAFFPQLTTSKTSNHSYITTGPALTRFFLLLAALGYSRTISLLLCAPPFFFATIMAFISTHTSTFEGYVSDLTSCSSQPAARHSDKVQERWLHIVVPLLFGIIGFIIAMA